MAFSLKFIIWVLCFALIFNNLGYANTNNGPCQNLENQEPVDLDEPSTVSFQKKRFNGT